MAAILDISIGEGVLTYFVFVLVINVFHIWLYGHPLEAIGPKGSNYFSRRTV